MLPSRISKIWSGPTARLMSMPPLPTAAAATVGFSFGVGAGELMAGEALAQAVKGGYRLDRGALALLGLFDGCAGSADLGRGWRRRNRRRSASPCTAARPACSCAAARGRWRRRSSAQARAGSFQCSLRFRLAHNCRMNNYRLVRDKLCQRRGHIEGHRGACGYSRCSLGSGPGCHQAAHRDCD